MKKIFRNISLILLAAFFTMLPLSAFADNPVDLTVQANPSSNVSQNADVVVTFLIQDNSVDGIIDAYLKANIPSGLQFEKGTFRIGGSPADDKNYDSLNSSSGLFLDQFNSGDSNEVEFTAKWTGTSNQTITGEFGGNGLSEPVTESQDVAPAGSNQGTGNGSQNNGTGSQNNGTGSQNNGTTNTNSQNCKFDSTDLGGTATTLCNPLPDQNLTDFNVRIVNFVLGVAGALAIVAIVQAGLKMIMSGGNEEAITSAKNTITWAIVGLLIAILAYSIVAIIETQLKINVSNNQTNTTQK